MKIEIEKVDGLVAQADKITIAPEGEEVLLELLEIRDQVESALNIAKERIKKAALEMNPNFKSIQSNKLRVSYRSYGSRFVIEEGVDPAQLPKEVTKTEVKVTLDTEALEKYIDEKGMPAGVKEADRPKVISIEPKKPKEIDGETPKSLTD